MPSANLDEFIDQLARLIAVRVQSRMAMMADTPRNNARLLTVKQAADYIGRTEQAVQHLIHKQELIVVRRGRRVHLDRADLDKWIDTNKV